jgi:hypothetical protein
MKGAWIFVIGIVCGAAVTAVPKLVMHLHAAWHHVGTLGNSDRVHSEEQFSFIANGPLEQVAPLFGADKERTWAPGWNPEFVHPVPAADQQGMVFTTAHGHLTAAWVNTLFDKKSGRFQYVYVVPDVLVTVIRIQLQPQGERTKVDVEYERTALSPETDAHVRRMAEGDHKSGPEWEQQVNGYLQSVSR